MNPLLQVGDLGQSIWCDALSRAMLLSGRLKMLIDQVGLGGVTSNPAIFEKAIGDDYHPALRQAAQSSLGVKAIYEAMVVRDIQDAADLLRPVYEKSGGRDGFVSLEVSPALAFDTAGSIEEGGRLFQACGRDNVMIKIPATAAGLPAITALIGRGIPVNVTLLFDVATYEQVALAYITGLEQVVALGRPIDRIASVASFFVSRIDVVVDGLLAARAAADPRWTEVARSLAGKIAIANAKVAYRRFQAILARPRFVALQRQGAQPQRLLWASTATKNPAYSDVYYVEALIGPDTVNTLPEQTLAAFRDHGRSMATLAHDMDAAEDLLKKLTTCDIDMTAVARDLLTDGVRIFDEAFLRLMGTIGRQRQVALSDRLPTMSYSLGALAPAVSERVGAMRTLPRAIWQRDATLWGQVGLMPGLGWLDLPTPSQENARLWAAWAETARPFRHLLLVGMGGSALSAAVLRQTFGILPGYPALHVLDRIDGLRTLESQIDLEQTMILVASKSGGTVETRLLFDYFHDRISKTVSDAAAHFVVMTDEGSPLASIANARGIPTILCETPDLGGRYSALSRYGMVPAAMMGLDVASLADRVEWMRQSCGADLPSEENPAVVLGVAMAEAARQGRNKLTFVLSPALSGLGLWLAQLIAESTGKDGRGIAPIVGEPLGDPSVYGDDRLFVQIALRAETDDTETATLAALVAAGHPVIHLQIGEPLDIGQMFYLWEMATAAASAVIGVHPFDQPDVEEGKREARRRLAATEADRPTDAPPALIAEGMTLWGDVARGAPTFDAAIAAHLHQIKPGDYVALTAYLSEEYSGALGDLRRVIRDGTGAATMVGFGPRYLHSTAQFFRGGGNQGVFFQLTMDDPEAVPISGDLHTFGALLAAQAAGDFQTLVRRGRRILRLHLGSDVAAGLARLQRAALHALEDRP